MTSWLKQKLRGEFVTNLATLASGTVIGQIVFICATPIITRLYTPEEIGTINLYVAVATVVFFVACLRLELAVLMAKTDEDAVCVMSLVLASTGVMVVLSTAAVILLGEWFCGILGAPGLSKWLLWLPLNVFFYGFYLAFRYWSTRKKDFGHNSVSQVVMYSTTAGSRVGAGFVGWGVFGLMTSYIAGRAVTALYLTIVLGKKYSSSFFKKITFQKLKATLVEYKNLPLYETPQTMVSLISWLIPTYLLTYFFTIEIVGYYSMALQLIVLPVTFTGEAIRQVFLQRASELKDKGEDLGRYLMRITLFLGVVGFLPCVALALLGPIVFGFVLGDDWTASGLYSRILAPWIFFYFCNLPSTMMVQILKKQKIHFVLSLVLLVLRVGSICVGGYMNDVLMSLVAYSAIGTLFYVFHTTLVYYFAKKRVNKTSHNGRLVR